MSKLTIGHAPRENTPPPELTPPTPFGAWVLHQYAGEAMRAVLGAFDREGIEALPVKGIVLANELYDQVGDRPISDVDLRVRPRDLSRAVRAAEREGWRVYRNSKQLGSRAIELHSVLVELETTLGPPGLCAVSVDDLLARSHAVVSPAGVAHRVPELHDHALVIGINAFKDKLGHLLPWTITDLERLAAHPSFEPRRMAALASEARLRAVIWLVADWMHRTRASMRWREVRDLIAITPPRPAFVRAYQRLAARGQEGFLLSLLARAGSDAPLMRAKALALGGIGTLAFACAARLRV